MAAQLAKSSQPVYDRKRLAEKLKERQRIEIEIEKELGNSLSLAVSLILGLLLTGTVFFHYSEKLEWIDSFYFSGVTMTSVGYGDITPTNDASKIFTVFFTIISLSVFVYSASIISSEILARVKERVLIRRLRRLSGEAEEQGKKQPIFDIKTMLGLKRP